MGGGESGSVVGHDSLVDLPGDEALVHNSLSTSGFAPTNIASYERRQAPAIFA